MRANLEGNLVARRAAAADRARLSPTADSFIDLGLDEVRLHRTRAAIETLSRVGQSDFPQDASVMNSWALRERATYHHELGEYDAQLEAARQGQQQWPADGAFFTQEAGALIALGRLAEVEAVFTRCERAPLRSGGLGSLLDHAARELAAHGHAEVARAVAIRASSWYRDRIDAGNTSPALRSAYAGMLYLAGDCDRAVAMRRAMLHETPDNLSVQSAYATELVLCGGSPAQARRIADSLAKVNHPFLRGDHLFYRARILAALGDGDGAVRALQAAFRQGRPWYHPWMHLDYTWDPIRSFPAFVEWMTPKG
jgi:tetratricopeptide (TPR) repeat protein